MPNLVEERVALARKGLNPTVVCRVRSGWLVVGDVQFLHGYCVLLADPVAPSLNDLDASTRATFLDDMSQIGDALLEVTDAYRINYGILGNSEPSLHAHIFPRYLSEPDEKRRYPSWFYDWKNAPPFDRDASHPLIEALASALRSRGVVLEDHARPTSLPEDPP